MNEECLRAQQTLSEASDGVSVTAEDLKNAKAHCAACDECLAYVSALAALKKTPPPVAPEGLSDQVIAAVRAEAEQMEAEKIAAAALLASQAEQSAADAASGYPASGAESTAPRPAIRADNWKSWAPWAAAATVVLLIAGFAVMRGAAFIGGGDDAARSDSRTFERRGTSLRGRGVGSAGRRSCGDRRQPGRCRGRRVHRFRRVGLQL